jgi:2-polyprenyl-3-methyl-5-hydroxy-6-metoxy-1,4-benzoquinol methylase
VSIYEGIAPYYDKIFPLRPARLDYVRALCAHRGARVLDIGCATGSLALELGREGHVVTGIDLDGAMIALASERARVERIAAGFHALDMLALGAWFAPGTFDLALCLGNTIVHLPDRDAVRTFLRNLAGLLGQGARIVVQLLNYSRVVAGLAKPLPAIETADVSFVRSGRYDAPAHRVIFSTALTLKATGEKRTEETTLYPLEAEELVGLLPGSGMSPRVWHADYSGRPFAPDDESYIVQLQRD